MTRAERRQPAVAILRQHPDLTQLMCRAPVPPEPLPLAGKHPLAELEDGAGDGDQAVQVERTAARLVPAGEHKVMAGGDDLAQFARQRARPVPAPPSAPAVAPPRDRDARESRRCPAPQHGTAPPCRPGRRPSAGCAASRCTPAPAARRKVGQPPTGRPLPRRVVDHDPRAPQCHRHLELNPRGQEAALQA